MDSDTLASRERAEGRTVVEPTDVSDPNYFHKVVDCQWACPAHTPVPEYIRKIASGDHSDAYMINWKSNVFPGILGRTCDRPCEPACRRGRLEEQPVAICRLKRVAADHKQDIARLLPGAPSTRNGKRIACVGAGPASLTVARDLSAIGYEVVVFDSDSHAGGMMRSQIPKFRLPDEVIDEEVGYALSTGGRFVAERRIDSLKSLISEGYDAIFVGCGAPRGRNLDIPGRREATSNIHIGIEWLASVSFGHVSSIGRRVIVLGGGNTAMDCCRTSLRLGGAEVKVIVRSGFAEMKASSWEKEDALREGVAILNFLAPKAFTHEAGRLTGVVFEKMEAKKDERGRRVLTPAGEPDLVVECDDVLIAVGQENAFPWIEPDAGVAFDRDGMPAVDPITFQSSLPKIFFGGDAAFGPKNIITAVAHGHDAAISINAFCRGEDVRARPDPMTNLVSQKMGIHEWSYDNAITLDRRFRVPHVENALALRNIQTEVELGFDLKQALGEAQRCLNCDVQTVFSAPLCIECDACVDVCPIDCISFVPNAPEDELRQSLMMPALNLSQAIYVSEPVKTRRVMVKDEDLCLHCGLCAERCPTGAWDMMKFTLEMAQAGQSCRSTP
ncbi:MAG: FAD-dependent oxidoreductase [Hyphomicrobiales bacterium]|nr:FAD-dependent oxidoreductase [Hyphomicrobiales bacterium]